MVSVDSLKLRINYEDTQILNDSLLAHWIQVNELTGEVRSDKDFRDNAYYIKDNGISTRYAIEKQITSDKSIKPFVAIAINSKMLGNRYFEGITPDNIKLVYDYLINQKIVEFSYDTFLGAQCTDTDYKKDFVCTDIDTLIIKLESITKASNKKGEGCQKFTKYDNKGIQWSDRRTTSINRAPYIKIYSKHLDLTYNSKDFANVFLNDKDTKDLTRVEFTIKNRKHFKVYGITDTSLKSIISIQQDTLNTMLHDTIKKHTEKAIRPLKTNTEGKLSAGEQKIINLIQMAIDCKIGISELRRYITLNLNKKTASRTQSEIDKVWLNYFSKLSEVKELNQVEKWLSEVGINF